MSETHAEQIARVEMMAEGQDTWDLSPNDLDALNAVLYDRAELLKALQECVRVLEDMGHGQLVCALDAKVAIGEAEGKRMRIPLDIPRYEP